MIEIKAKVDGMMCSMCESHVNDAVRAAFKVHKVTSNHSKGETVIQTETDISDEELKQVIGATGYEVGTITRSEHEKRGLFGRRK